MARTFKKLAKEKNFEDFNRFAKEVTMAYATSPITYSQSNVAMDNNLTKKGLRDLMDYAIINNLVSKDTAIQILNKSIQNQQRKANEAGGSSIKHHKELMKKREKFLAYTYSRLEVNDISSDIANNSSETISYFTRKYNIESDRVTKEILERAILENIVSDEIMKKIISRSLKNNSSEYAQKYFNYLQKEREKNKEKNSQ